LAVLSAPSGVHHALSRKWRLRNSDTLLSFYGVKEIVPRLRSLFNRGDLKSRDESRRFTTCMDDDELEGDVIGQVEVSCLPQIQVGAFGQKERNPRIREISGVRDDMAA
jgi:hypothetical protein